MKPEALKSALIAALIVLCVCLSILVMDADLTVVQFRKNGAVTQQKLNNDLDEAHRLILEAGLTATEARKASTEEGQYLSQWNKQISTTMQSANTLLLSAAQTSDSIRSSQQQIAQSATIALGTLNDTIKGLQPVEQTATQTFANLDKSATDLDSFINSPDLMGTAHNLNTITGNFGVISGDFEKKFHAVLYPPPCQGHWCWVIKAWPVIKAASEMAEPGYWISQTIR